MRLNAGITRSEFDTIGLNEVSYLVDAINEKNRRDDLRIGRGFAALINFIGQSFDENFKGITELDLFPEKKEKKVEVTQEKRITPTTLLLLQDAKMRQAQANG